MLTRSRHQEAVRTASLDSEPCRDVLLAGPWEWAEFAALRRAVDPDSHWPVVPRLAEAIARLAREALPPQVVLLALPRPDVDSQAVVEQLRIAAPLARVVVVAGSWCEGELRTGRPLAGVVRLYWYELPAWWRAAQAALGRRESPPWSAPLDDVGSCQRGIERPAAALGDVATSARRRVAAVAAGDYAVFESLAALLGPTGWTVRWQPPHRRLPNSPADDPPASAGIWDGGQLSTAELVQLREFCNRFDARPAPVLALLDFPRVEHLESASAAGAAGVFGKPYDVTLLAAELFRVAASVETNC